MKTTKKTAKKAKPEFDFRTIKFFEDACKKENIDSTKLPDVSMIPEVYGRDLIARYKLEIIYLAINNGWIARGGDVTQAKWYVYHWVLPSGSGFGFSCSYYDCAGTYASAGLRLCTFNKEQSDYIKDQFTDLWKDTLL